MKSLLLSIVVLALSASAAEPLSEFLSLSQKADALELCWRDDFPVEKIGIQRLKQRYVGQEQIAAAVARLTVDKEPRPQSGFDKEGRPWFDSEALVCQCADHFTHRLRAFSGGKPIAEVSISLDGRLVALIAKNERIRITDSALAWLKSEADWDRDVDALMKFEKTKKANQALEPTATAVTDRAAHAPRQP
jgi:hypothetical protein